MTDAIFESYLDKQGQPVPVVLTAEERDALYTSAAAMQLESSYCRKAGMHQEAVQYSKRAADIRGLLARSVSG